MEQDLRVLAEETEQDNLQAQDPEKCAYVQSAELRRNIQQGHLALQLNVQNVVRS